MADGHKCYYTGQSEPCPNDAEVERLRAALAICHGTLIELMSSPFAPASSHGEYAVTLCIDTAAEALGK